MLSNVGVYLFTRSAIEAKLRRPSGLKRVGEEVKLVILGLQDQVVCGSMEGVDEGASAPIVCKIAKW